jgi:hypothetical protein
MDIDQDKLPETSTVHVEISPLISGFMWRFRRIIAQARILWIRVLCILAVRPIRGPSSRHARRLAAVLPPPLAKAGCELAEPKASSTSGTRTSAPTPERSAQATRRSPSCGSRLAVVPLAACRGGGVGAAAAALGSAAGATPRPSRRTASAYGSWPGAARAPGPPGGAGRSWPPEVVDAGGVERVDRSADGLDLGQA